MVDADQAHHKIARWYAGDKLAQQLVQLGEKYHHLDISGLRSDPGLLDSLNAAQLSVLIPLVEADLELFSHGAILYKELPGNLQKKLYQVLGNPDKIRKFNTKEIAVTRTHEEAYEYYCGMILDTDTFRLDPTLASGMALFMRRNPRGEALLRRVTDHFLRNLATCIRRIANDKEAIETCFFSGGTLQEITRIQATGSDFHKGGQQVLMVDMRGLDLFLHERELRLVYKPSDVEFDYRIVGRNRPEFLAFLESRRQSDPAGYPLGKTSLYELLNDAVFGSVNQRVARRLARKYGGDAACLEERLALPTYTILPRNPGSRLKEREGRHGIRSSYGYIEYLDHQPDAPAVAPGTEANMALLREWVLRKYREAGPHELAGLDWITQSPAEARICHRLWGRIIAIATVFQQTDLHHQNLRLRGRRPHIIDLENALAKTISGPNGTAIPFHFERPAAGISEIRPVLQAGGPPEQEFAPITHRPFSKKAWSNSMLLMLEKEEEGGDFVNARQVTARATIGSEPDPAIARHLTAGLAEALRLMAAPENRQAVSRWVQDAQLDESVVRNVVEATGELASMVTASIARRLGNPSQPEEKTLAGLCEDRRRRVFGEWQERGEDRQNPYFALNHVKWHGADLQSLDVPSYYQRVKSRDLMASDGRMVSYLPPKDTSQKKAEKNDAFAHYLIQSGFELLTGSFGENLPVDHNRLKARIQKFKEESVPQSNLGGF